MGLEAVPSYLMSMISFLKLVSMTMMYNRLFASIATFVAVVVVVVVVLVVVVVVVVVAAAMNVVMQLYRWADKVMAPLGNPL